MINAGTGTVKTALVEVSEGGARSVRTGSVERGGSEELPDLFRAALREIACDEVDAVAHRIVHGGVAFVAPVRIDADVERSLEALIPLAPLHNGPALEGIRAARQLYPRRPAVAVFDTAFHAGRSLESRLYALPWRLVERYSLYRFGFHGIAHASLLEALAREEGVEARALDAVTLQLGGGCSASAIACGACIETSMGFSPLGGIPMATRSGDVDPSIVFHLARQGHALDEIETLLNEESGLRGLAGSADLRDVLRAEARGDSRAAIALGHFVRRIVATVGAYFTLLEGRGRLVFGGGIGTHSAVIRERIAAGLRAWDVALDPERNAAGGPGRISQRERRGVYVFETREEPLIAREAAALLSRERV